MATDTPQMASGGIVPSDTPPVALHTGETILTPPQAEAAGDTPQQSQQQAEPQVEEVEYEAAKEEQATVQTQAAEDEPQEDVLDIIVPKAEPRVWTIGPEHMKREYVQKPLAFIAKMQWFSLVGDVLDKALSGPNGMSLNSLLNVPGRPGQLSMADFADADTFVQAIGKLLAVAPDFLVKSYCIWLNVPDYEREMVATMMAAPPDEGGLSDEDGLAIIETFIVQNYDALADFFGERLTKLGRIVQKKSELHNQARESQRSKR